MTQTKVKQDLRRWVRMPDKPGYWWVRTENPDQPRIVQVYRYKRSLRASLAGQRLGLVRSMPGSWLHIAPGDLAAAARYESQYNIATFETLAALGKI